MADAKPKLNLKKLIMVVLAAVAGASGADFAGADMTDLDPVIDALAKIGFVGSAMLIVWGELRLVPLFQRIAARDAREQAAEAAAPIAPPAPATSQAPLQAPIRPLRPVRDGDT